MLSLQVPNISGMNLNQVRGLLLSYLSAVTEVTESKRKVSYLTHFYKERLNRFERKKLILILNHFIVQLDKLEKKDTLLSGSNQTGNEKLPKEFAELFNFFKRI